VQDISIFQFPTAARRPRFTWPCLSPAFGLPTARVASVGTACCPCPAQVSSCQTAAKQRMPRRGERSLGRHKRPGGFLMIDRSPSMPTQGTTALDLRPWAFADPPTAYRLPPTAYRLPPCPCCITVYDYCDTDGQRLCLSTRFCSSPAVGTEAVSPAITAHTVPVRVTSQVSCRATQREIDDIRNKAVEPRIIAIRRDGRPCGDDEIFTGIQHKENLIGLGRDRRFKWSRDRGSN